MGSRFEIFTTAFLVRVCFAFAFAPLASVPIFVGAELLHSGRLDLRLATLLPTAAFAYAPTFAFLIVFGWPVGYFMVRFWRASIFDFAILGALAGPSVVLLFVFISWIASNSVVPEVTFTYSGAVKKLPTILFLALLGAAESILFWLIARPDRLQRPKPQIPAYSTTANSGNFNGD